MAGTVGDMGWEGRRPWGQVGEPASQEGCRRTVIRRGVGAECHGNRGGGHEVLGREGVRAEGLEGDEVNGLGRTQLSFMS